MVNSNHIKSKLACEWTIENYFEAEVKKGRRMAFWTITTLDARSVQEVAYMWKLLNQKLRRKYRSFWSCVRVFEMHPGEVDPDGEEHSHGLHIHFITSVFIPIKVIRSMCVALGFGRIGVELVHSVEGVRQYLSKYLSKSQADSQCRAKCLKGMRLWAPCGDLLQSPLRSKVSNIVHDTPLRRFFHYCRGAFFTYDPVFKSDYFAAGENGRRFRFRFMLQMVKTYYVDEIRQQLLEGFYLDGWISTLPSEEFI